MKIHVGGSLFVTNFNQDQFNVISSGLSLVNPVYAVMKRQGNVRALYAIPQFIKYYKRTADGLVVGRGVLPRLIRHFKDHIDFISTDVCTDTIKDGEFKSSIKLRDYQEGCTEEILKNVEGILQLSVGFGKTYISIKMIEETQLKTLIIVPRLNLLKQFKSDIKNLCGYDPGIINGPTFNIKDVTLATIQTLKKRDLTKLRKYFGMVIADECHTVPSVRGTKVIESFNPFRLYGMSGTPDRSDGQGEAIKFMFGDIIINRSLPQSLPAVEVVRCAEEMCEDTYAAIIDSQVDNIKRNVLIVDKSNESYSMGRKVLILTKRTRHCDELIKMIDTNKIKCHIIKSQLPVKEQVAQDKLLESLRDGGRDLDIIMGTFGLLSTGINIPALDTIIFAGDIKSSVLVTQSIGRILRLFDGKQSPKIIDIDDVKSGILHNQARLRKKFYLTNGWGIIK